MNQSHSNGSVMLGLLTLLFVGLKLTDHIDWSWWWVLAPTWIPLSIALLALAFVGILIAWRG